MWPTDYSCSSVSDVNAVSDRTTNTRQWCQSHKGIKFQNLVQANGQFLAVFIEEMLYNELLLQKYK